MSAQPKPKQAPPEPVSEKRDERHAWEEEQAKHDYYYDDAHGYEVYNPDLEEIDSAEHKGKV